MYDNMYMKCHYDATSWYAYVPEMTGAQQAVLRRAPRTLVEAGEIGGACVTAVDTYVPMSLYNSHAPNGMHASCVSDSM